MPSQYLIHKVDVSLSGMDLGGWWNDCGWIPGGTFVGGTFFALMGTGTTTSSTAVLCHCGV
eukprot:1096605-Pelagomonas_calceolata.AAC.1